MDRSGRGDLMHTLMKSVSRGKSTARGNTAIRDREGVLHTKGEEIRERDGRVMWKSCIIKMANWIAKTPSIYL